ncbi:histone deacetylase superfamily [Gracilinema caldarium DSM 7334]|uniref:Histone deacetylase superfamily n=2 Tax=Gracilinema caldarium TaxID=215591 RepID=F8F277_GRAC1|nr:histone deacetylase superfamily [Gracilinema caldarium DSM 7334]
MILLYDPALDMRFPDYGIQIPIRDRRALAVLEYLKKKIIPPMRPVHSLASAADMLSIPEGDRHISREDIARAHDANFVAALFGEGLEKELIKTYELMDEQGRFRRYSPGDAVRPLSELFTTIRAQVWGTYLACRLALAHRSKPSGVSSEPLSTNNSNPGFCYYLGGGMHHARYDSGAGFCLLNDIIIAARRLKAEGLISSIWIIDLDAHKGDGTAELASGDPCILTLSIHMALGWPLDPETLAHAVPSRAPLVASDVDIPVSKEDQASYVSRLASGLLQLEMLSGGKKPDLAIVVDGADPYEKDELPSSVDLQLPLDTCVKRDMTVFSFLRDRAIPSTWLLAGGYGDYAWEPPAHFLTKVLTP